jgi:dTDP-4-dehydrorhamnose reductase
MKKVFITGCYGQLGKAMNQLLAAMPEIIVVNTDVDTLDITNLEQVRQKICDEKPDTIINCAAYTSVDRCEIEKELAYQINAIGPKNLAIAARENQAVMVQVSTDYVFPGTQKEPRIESDEPAPCSTYGSTKLAGERFVQQEADRYFIFRTAWLYGEGKNFVKTMLKLSETHDEISVVNDQFGSPTSALELARMMLHVIPTKQYGIYHATCEGSTNWYAFTVEIFHQAGISTKVNPVSSQQYATMNPASANRPEYSVLENQKLNQLGDYRMKEWKEALNEYMQQMGFAKN